MASSASKADRAANREKYCVEKLTPVLQGMVAEMLKVLPEDPEEYMRVWLDAKIVEEGGCPPGFVPQPVACFSAAPPEIPDERPAQGTEIEITGEILPEEEATRLSTISQLILDTPGAHRATLFTVRGSVVPMAEAAEVEKLAEMPAPAVAAAAPEPKLSTMSQVMADTPGAGRHTVVTVRGTIVPEADVARLSSMSQILADTPGASRGTVVTVQATVTLEEAARLSTLSQAGGAAPTVALRGIVAADELPLEEGARAVDEPVTVLGHVVATRVSTMSQLMADTPGASRATCFSVRGSIVPVQETSAVEKLADTPAPAVAAAAPEPKMSTISQVMADTPGAGRHTVVTVRGTIVPEADVARLSSMSQILADTPGASRGTVVTVRATVTEEEAARLSTLSQTGGAPTVALRGIVAADELAVPLVEGAPPLAVDEPVTVLGYVVSEPALAAEQARLSTLTQLMNQTPGAARGTLLTVRGSVIPTGVTQEQEARMSTMSQILVDTPGASRGTVVTVRGSIASKPGEIVTAQVVVPAEEVARLSSLSQIIADTPGSSRATVTVRGTVVQPAETARMSTLSQIMADTPGAQRGTVASVLGGLGAA